MTQLLEKAVKRLSSLPDGEQDALASFILSELDSERRWDELFASSEDILSEMAEQALAEERAGKTSELDLDRDFPQN
jgi:hypothetical protein